MLIIIQDKFTTEEAVELKTKHKKDGVCLVDRNGFNMFNAFKGNKVKGGNKSKLTEYMVAKAIEFGAEK